MSAPVPQSAIDLASEVVRAAETLAQFRVDSALKVSAMERRLSDLSHQYFARKDASNG